MAGISQTIPSYYGGISEQADELKNPGQVKNIVNGIPDLTWGLYKRPGAERIVSPDTDGLLANVQSGGSWFHYYRDESEGSYIGQIASDGVVRIWKASGHNAGDEQTVTYGSTESGTATNIKSYLTSSNSEDIQCTTINDTTIVTNRSKVVTMTSDKTDSPVDWHWHYIELIKTENGRQYGFNVYDSESTTTIKTATRIKINANSLDTDWGTGNCPGIGTQVFGGTETNGTGQTNLTFRLTVLGQVGDRAGDDDGDADSNSYRCAYSKSVDLLHGGEGWDTDDVKQVTLDSAETNYTYDIKVVDHEELSTKGHINSGYNGVCRPAPTPWDAQTSVTADAILGGMKAELSGTGLTSRQVGNGLYLHRGSGYDAADEWNIEVLHPDLMRVTSPTINDVSKLPSYMRHGQIVTINNSSVSDEDNYYMKFVGEDSKDGSGRWEECAKPDIHKKIDAGTMPIRITRTSIANSGTATEKATFTVDRISWNQRTVGDETTNGIPEFVSRRTAYGHSDDEDRVINKVLFFRNRLCFLSGEWIVTSQPGDLYNFWKKTSLTVSNTDAINISCSSTLPSPLYDGIETGAGLLSFTTHSQYLLSSDDAIFNSDTAKLRPVSSYNYNKDIPPVSLGTTIGFIDNSNKYSRFYEMVGTRREGDAVMIDQNKVVPTLLEKDIDLITNSRENGLVFFGKTGDSNVIIYKYLTIGDQRIQSAWFKWKFKNNLKYHFIIDDTYYFLDSDDYLQKVNLVQATSDPSIDEEGTNFLLHLDNWTTIFGGVYSAATNLTTFTNGTNSCVSSWIDDVTGGTSNLVVIDTETGNDRYGRYAPCTITSGTTFTVPGDWATNVASGTPLHIGYLYDYQIDLPKFYTSKQVGQDRVSDTSASLILHRLNLSFGKIGLYETTLNRVGKIDYTDVHESTTLSKYNVSDAPYIDEVIKTIPVYEKNKNVDITIKSTHPAPATLRSLSWEGDYSPMYYRRG
jgi:hypothetical protein